MPTLILRPNADVTKTSWSGEFDATNLYANVDESSKSEIDYNRGTDITTNQWLAVKIGSTVYKSSAHSYLGATVELCTWEKTTKPSDSSAWTWSDIDNLVSGCVYNNTTTDYPLLYGYPNHTTESGTITKVTFKSYLNLYLSGKTYSLSDYMTWVEVEYTPGNKAKIIIF